MLFAKSITNNDLVDELTVRFHFRRDTKATPKTVIDNDNEGGYKSVDM